MNFLNKINFYIALASAKSANFGLHLLNSSGTSMPGLVALKIQKNFVSSISEYCKENIITITGTNGKTTTAGLIAHIIKSSGCSVLHNEKGANMLSGIASSLAVSYKPFTKFDYAVLESDEAYLTKLYDYMNADYLLVTNLFRDQLDRYGELDTTAKKIQDAISKNQNLKVVLNADDPIVAGLGGSCRKIYFGFDEIIYNDSAAESQSPPESALCKCGTRLTYTKRYYAHVGDYFCPECGNKRPELDYSGRALISSSGAKILVSHNSDVYEFTTGLVGVYNAYNVLAAITAALEQKIDAKSIQSALDTYKSVFGRAEKFMLEDKPVLVQLIKNPTGASEVLRTINKKSTAKLLIIINDNYADGRDVSWLWDSDFEMLADYPSEIVVSGIRADDMAVRLKYAGINPKQIVTVYDIKSAIKYALKTFPHDAEGQLVIMPTYTALLEMQQILNNKNKFKHFCNEL